MLHIWSAIASLFHRSTTAASVELGNQKTAFYLRVFKTVWLLVLPALAAALIYYTIRYLIKKYL